MAANQMPKPCPFCGSPARIKRNKTVMVSCSGCSASTFQLLQDPDSAIAAWNRRAAADSLVANLATVAALDEAFGIKAIHDDGYIYDTLPSSGIARAYFMARAAIAAATGAK